MFLRRLVFSLIAAAPLMLTPASAAAAEQAAAQPRPQRGCPVGAVCVYPRAGWNNNRPSLVLWSYGAHNLSNQFGRKRLFNNQTVGSVVWTCTGYNGSVCEGLYGAGQSVDVNFTPINSLFLARLPGS